MFVFLVSGVKIMLDYRLDLPHRVRIGTSGLEHLKGAQNNNPHLLLMKN